MRTLEWIRVVVTVATVIVLALAIPAWLRDHRAPWASSNAPPQLRGAIQ